MSENLADTLSTAQAAESLGITESLVALYCREGRLGTKVGRDWRITPEELQAFASIPREPGNPQFGKTSP